MWTAIVMAVRYGMQLLSQIAARIQQAHDEDNGATRAVEQQESKALEDVARRQEIDASVASMSDPELNSSLQHYTKDH